MYKWITLLLAVLVVTDPILGMMEHYGITHEFALASFIALIATPWVVSQFDN